MLLASVVIPTHNQQHILEYCLQILFNQTASPDTYELVIVDDGSNDGTSEMVQKLQEKAPCPLIYNWHPNIGRSLNRNTGALMAHGKYLIFLDGDMLVRREFVSAHLSAHTKPGLIAHGPVVYTEELKDPDNGQKKVYDFSRAFFATGNVSLEREQFIASGMFDADFIEYGWEDLELGERLRKMGLQTVRCPEAWSYHLQKRLTYEGIPGLIAKEKERGHMGVLFYRKNPSIAVQLMTLISPIYFAYDRILTICHWPEKPGTLKLLQHLDRPGTRFFFRLLVEIVKSHAYADGLREALAREGKSENSNPG